MNSQPGVPRHQSPDMEHSVAVPSNLNKQQIVEIAEALAKQIAFVPGGSMADVVHRLGGRIDSLDYWKEPIANDGSLIVKDLGDFEILVPLHTSVSRDRFTIAHELGHYFLHFVWRRHKGEDVRSMRANRYGSDRAEWEANWFASAFLMPSEEFRRSFQTHRGKVALVADEFRVSPKAAEVRAKALGLVPNGGNSE